nr:putative ribonuclease H-like domain-containing protein [Tanacetum cinerariifolium]
MSSRIFKNNPFIKWLHAVLHLFSLAISLNTRDIGYTSSSSSATLLLSTYCDDYPMPISLSKQTPTPINPPTAHVSPCKLCHDASPTPLVHTSQLHNVQPTPTSPVGPSTASMSSHPMVTCSKVGTFKTHHITDLTHVSSSTLHQAIFASNEPKGFKTVARDPKRFAAMRDEMNALKLNNTWDLVPRPSNSNVLVPSGYFVPNSMPMPPLINLRPGSSLKVSLKSRVWITLPLSIPL